MSHVIARNLRDKPMPNHARTDDQAPPHPRTRYKESQEAERKMFSRRLWRLMVGKGWNQSELSRQSGVGRDMISGYIRGKHLPEPPHARRLADAFGITIEALFPAAAEVAAAPAAAAAATLEDLPPIEMRSTTPGMVMLHVNQEMSQAKALKVLALLQEPEA
jgi:transcriptional regulator with XRE-family HTH domain